MTVITNDLDSILTRPAQSVAVGVRPSGSLHLGNITTVAIAAILAQQKGAEVHLTVCDIDMPTIKRGTQQTSARYFKYQPVENTTQAQLTTAELSTFTEELSRTLSVPFRTDILSNVQATHQYRAGLARVIADTPALREIFDGEYALGDKRVPIHPVCPCCKHTPRSQAIYLGKDRLKARCRNEKCEENGQWKIINVHDKKEELGVHYFIDPIRDVMLQPKANIHVFGGDYFAPHGKNELPKVEKVRRITELTGKATPDYFVGPLLQGPEDWKISKSEGTTEFTLKNLRANYDGSIPFTLYVARFAEQIIRNGRGAVPHALITEFFKTAPELVEAR
jgi:hypothetical protein